MTGNQVTDTSKRKDEHLRICLEEDVNASVPTGLEKISLAVEALPEIDYEKIDTRVKLFGKQLSAPIFISSMTGGSSRAGYFNQMLAETAEKYQIPMGVGSQRAALEIPELEKTFRLARLSAPTTVLFANLGVAQLNYGFTTEDCQRAVEMLQADALYLHLNSLQEALQPEGNRNFEDLLAKIERVSKSLEVPLLVKEVGCGISRQTALKLIDAGVSGIDVAGLGGTSWARVEMYRQTDPARKALCASFGDWGIPTVDCLLEMQDLPKEVMLLASGGLRSGIDAAKTLAMGARLAGFARRFILSANAGEESLYQSVDQLIFELKTAMFCTGSAGVQDLIGKWKISKDIS